MNDKEREQSRKNYENLQFWMHEFIAQRYRRELGYTVPIGTSLHSLLFLHSMQEVMREENKVEVGEEEVNLFLKELDSILGSEKYYDTFDKKKYWKPKDITEHDTFIADVRAVRDAMAGQLERGWPIYEAPEEDY